MMPPGPEGDVQTSTGEGGSLAEDGREGADPSLPEWAVTHFDADGVERQTEVAAEAYSVEGGEYRFRANGKVVLGIPRERVLYVQRIDLPRPSA